MERLKNLELYRKILLILTALMVIVFSILYSVILRRTGFLFRGSILIPGEQDGLAVYSGRVRGVPSSFAVSPGAEGSKEYTVTFVFGGETCGPYHVKEDPAAVPQTEMSRFMTGVKVSLGSEVLFRGGMMRHGGITWLYDENGEIANIGFALDRGGETVYMTGPDEGGAAVPGPSAAEILDLIYGEKTSHKGDVTGLFMGISICVLNAVSMLFAEELFRWDMRFTIKDAERAEPTDWVIGIRRFSWAIFVITAFASFMIGLR